MAASLVGHQGVEFIDDDVFAVTQRLPVSFLAEHNRQAFRSCQENVGRFRLRFRTFRPRSIPGPGGDSNGLLRTQTF